jgi:hypothetical protein
MAAANPNTFLSLEFLSVNGLPIVFHEYLISGEELDFEQDLKSPSSSKAYLVRRRSSGNRLVLKTVLDDVNLYCVYPAYCSLLTSLLSPCFYFLAPIQGFTASPPLGVFYSCYSDLKLLRSFLVRPGSLTPTHLSLIAAFICFAMSYLETGQLVHGSLHSGNIFLTEEAVPIITDWGLSRSYDFFRDDGQADQIAWVAPELLLGDAPNYSSDVYSYGVLLFEMFEGRRPFAQLTNIEYLVALKAGLLSALDFEKTPPDWRAFILHCTDKTPDRRPSFLELYQGLRGLFWPGSDADVISAVIDQYPARLAYRGQSPAQQPTLDLSEGAEILANPRHDQFEEYIQYCILTLPVDAVAGFCGALSRHGARGQPPELVTFTLAAVVAVAQRGSEFHEAVLRSTFFGPLHITALEQGDLLLDVLLPVFGDRALFRPSLFQAIASLFVYHPTEALNLLSGFVGKLVEFDHRTCNILKFILGLWPLFANSTLAGRYLLIIMWLCKNSKEFIAQFGREVAGFLGRFSGIPSKLFLATWAPAQLSLTSQEELQLVSHPYGTTILLRAPLSASPELAGLLIAAATDVKGWAVLIRYARMSEAHARTVVRAGGWFNRRNVDFSFGLLLALFVWPALRAEVGRTLEYFEILKVVVARKELALTHAICSLMQRVPVDEEYVRRASQVGLLGAYLQSTLESSDVTFLKFGIICVDVHARAGWAPEWTYAAMIVIELMKKGNHELMDAMMAVMMTLSLHPPSLTIMLENGLYEWFQGLQQYDRYAEVARIFLTNAKAFAGQGGVQ